MGEAGEEQAGGATTSLEALAALSGRSVGSILPAVTAAVAGGLLDASGPVLRWTSEDARQLVLGWLRTGEAFGVDPAGWLRRAAGHVEPTAPGTAVELLQAALPLAGEEQRPALVADLAGALNAAGRHEDAEYLCRQALPVAPPDVEVDLRRALVESLLSRGLVLPVAEEAAAGERSAPEGRRAWFLAARALQPLYGDRPDEAERLAGAADDLAVAEGDRRARVLALRMRVRAAQQAHRLHMAGRLSEQLVAEARRLPPGQADPEAYLTAALTFSDLDWHPDALDMLRAGTGLAGGLGEPAPTDLAAHAYGGAILLWMGELDLALAELRLALASERASGWTVDVRLLTAVIHAHRGERAEAARWMGEVDRLLDEGRPVSSPARTWWARAEAALADGRPEAAVTHLRHGWRTSTGAASLRELRRVGPYLLHVGGPDIPEADDVVASLARVAAANPGVPSLEGCAAWAAGLVAGDAGRVLAGLESLRRSGRLVSAARCGIDAARLLDDRRHAAVLAGEVVASLERAGAHGEAARASSVLRAAGIATPARRGGAGGGWASLTATEQRVAVLVADGLSNPEVAARLFVATRTVSTHVSHILRKLGVRSRTEVAVLVARSVGSERERALRAMGADEATGWDGPDHPARRP